MGNMLSPEAPRTRGQGILSGSLQSWGTEVQGDGHRVCRADQDAGPNSASGGIGVKTIVRAAARNRRSPLILRYSAWDRL